MPTRWLMTGLILVATSALSCENQGKGVGTDVVEQLCALNREAVLALHSEAGMAVENTGLGSYTYCDYWVDNDDNGVVDSPQVQGSCKAISEIDVEIVVAGCRRNGARLQNRCWHEMEAMLDCMKGELERASNHLNFFTEHFNCWTDVNGNGSYNGGVYWTWPADGSMPDAELNQPSTCATCEFEGTCDSCGKTTVMDANDKPIAVNNRCYLLKELPLKGDETIMNGGVTIVSAEVTDPRTGALVDRSDVCGDEFMALNLCGKESDLFLKAVRTGHGVAGAGAQ